MIALLLRILACMTFNLISFHNFLIIFCFVIVVSNMSNRCQNGVCSSCMSSHSSTHCDNFNQSVCQSKLLKYNLQKQHFDIDSSNYIFPSSRFKNDLFFSQQMSSTKMKSNEGTLCNMTYFIKFVIWLKQWWRTWFLIQYETAIRLICFWMLICSQWFWFDTTHTFRNFVYRTEKSLDIKLTFMF